MATATRAVSAASGSLCVPFGSLKEAAAPDGSALHSLDHGLKNITDALKQHSMWENTFLWLSADNGGDNPVGLASNYPLLGRKCLSWEGGTRTFAFLSGGLIPAAKRGTVNNQLMHVSDW